MSRTPAGCRQAAAADRAYIDEGNTADPKTVLAEEELVAERQVALCQALSELPPGCRKLVALLIADSPVSYAEISARLGIPIGSIGPSRRRCLAKLRCHPAIAMLIDADARPIACGMSRSPR